MRLTELDNNTRAKVVGFKRGQGIEAKVSALNIRTGKVIRKIVSEPFLGPIVIKIDNTKVVIGRGIAEKIQVEIVE